MCSWNIRSWTLRDGSPLTFLSPLLLLLLLVLPGDAGEVHAGRPGGGGDGGGSLVLGLGDLRHGGKDAWRGGSRGRRDEARAGQPGSWPPTLTTSEQIS